MGDVDVNYGRETISGSGLQVVCQKILSAKLEEGDCHRVSSGNFCHGIVMKMSENSPN